MNKPIQLTEEDMVRLQEECPTVIANIYEMVKREYNEAGYCIPYQKQKAWAELVGCRCEDDRWENCPIYE